MTPPPNETRHPVKLVDPQSDLRPKVNSESQPNAITIEIKTSANEKSTEESIYIYQQQPAHRKQRRPFRKHNRAVPISCCNRVSRGPKTRPARGVLYASPPDDNYLSRAPKIGSRCLHGVRGNREVQA